MTRLERSALMDRLARDARAIARRFGLRNWILRECSEEHRRKCPSRVDMSNEAGFGFKGKGTCWGCTQGAEREDGLVVRVRLFNRRSGRPLAYANIVDTLAHEVGHVATWSDCLNEEDPHTDEWQRAYQRILGWCRAEEIYDPGLSTEL